MPEDLGIAQGKEPSVKPGELIALNATEDKCYNKNKDGTKTRVKCPDVIVALLMQETQAKHPI